MQAIDKGKDTANGEKDDGDQAPKIDRLALAVGKARVCRRLGLAHAQQQEQLVRDVDQRMDRFRQHRRTAGESGRQELG